MKQPGAGVTVNIPALGAGDWRFESAAPDKILMDILIILSISPLDDGCPIEIKRI